MTREQYDRWVDFAIRMAKECYGTSRRPSGAWILEQVECFLSLREDDFAETYDWDSGPTYVCDRMSEFVTDNGFYHVEGAILRAAEARGVELSDDRVNQLIDEWEDRWFGPVHCCVRAGLDVAAEPSAGVLGFSVGDLRRMYPEGLPAWLTSLGWNAPLATAPNAMGVWL